MAAAGVTNGCGGKFPANKENCVGAADSGVEAVEIGR
jgi:hypothetical protein